MAAIANNICCRVQANASMIDTLDTIVALSSPDGRAGRAIIRLSGPRAIDIVRGSFRPTGGDALPAQIHHSNNSSASSGAAASPAWHAVEGRWQLSDSAAVPVLLLVMPGPRSYTRQDVAELHLPGNPLLCRAVISQLVEAGARPAAPGEFTARAFLNGRLDLAQAEAVMAIINAAGERALTAAEHLLAGRLSARIEEIIDRVRLLLAEVELAIDFAHEEVPTVSGEAIRRRALEARDAIVELGRSATAVEATGSNLRVVLVGRPNVGKSSLFNALAGGDGQRAIVSDIPGTTRDELRATIDMGDVRLVLSDTAGLEEAAATIESSASAERLRQAGQGRTAEALARAELVLMVVESPRLAADSAAAEDVASLSANLAAPLVLVVNKADESCHGASAAETAERAVRAINRAVASSGDCAAPAVPVVVTSARTGQGLDDLRQAMREALGGGRVDRAADAVSVSARHRRCLDDAAAALWRAARASGHAGGGISDGAADDGAGQAGWSHLPVELVALELREALDALGEITGRTSPQAVLEEIFGRFCIGK